jgi:glutaredoxin
MGKIMVTFYTKENCPLCEKAKTILVDLAKEFPIEIDEQDIYKDDAQLELYQVMIPVVEIDGEQIAYGIIEKDVIRKRLLLKMG